VSVDPIIHAGMRPGSLAYKAMAREHDRWVKAHGIVLATPTPELIARADAHAIRVRDRYYERRGKPVREKDPNGKRWVAKTAHGQVGAELLANLLRTPAEWNDNGERDEGFDILLPDRGLRLDTKTRQLFLTIEDKEWSPVASFYALIEMKDKRDYRLPFTFCGLITPEAFRALKFPIRLNGDWTCAVDTTTLIKPREFLGVEL
jgi:hypothetical protein